MRHRGFMLTEAIAAMFLLTLLAGLLIVAMNRQRDGERKMGDLRAAARLGEAALTAMQAGQPMPISPDKNSHVEVRPLASAADMPGWTWVQVRTSVNGRSTWITGLVPANTAGAASRP